MRWDAWRRLEEIRRKERRVAVGLMSGTSADGVSAALVEIEGSYTSTRLRLLGYRNFLYSPQLRREIFALFDERTSTVDRICRMNFVLGLAFADAAKGLIGELGLRAEDVDFIGSHGQTIYHIPQEEELFGYRTRSTMQIGDPSVIARETGIVTVGDFRKKDVAAGGYGAPIVPYFDYIMNRDRDIGVVFLNIGGIANFTYVPPGAGLEGVVAFDTGPGNMVIDAVASLLFGLDCDTGGAIASRGRVIEELLSELMEDPYFRQPPPKTTGRERYGLRYATRLIELARGRSPEDVLATASALTADTISRAIRDFVLSRGPVQRVYVSGGGAKNAFVVGRIARSLSPIEVRSYAELGVLEEAKEAVAMAVLANEFIVGRPSSVPSATGAEEPVILGVLALPW